MLAVCHLDMKAVYQFSHYDMSKGLSQNTVLAIAQDDMGFMWFGTKNGLNRFDGHFFKQYYAGSNEHSLETDYINVLCQGPDKRLWIGTDKGVFLYNSSLDSFERFSVKTKDGIEISANVNCIVRKDDYIYVSSVRQGLFRYDAKTGTLLNSSDVASYLRVTCMAVDEYSNLWVCLYGGEIYKMNSDLTNAHMVKTPDGQSFFSHTNISGIVIAEQGQMFVSNEDSGLSLVNINTGEVTSLMNGSYAKGKMAHSILRCGNEIWVATEDGLYVYEMFTHELMHYQYEATNPFSLSDNAIEALFCDKDGGLWAGTYFGGVNYSPLKASTFDCFFPRVDKANTLHGRRVREIAEDSNKYIWIGTEDGGLNRFNPMTGELNFFSESSSFSNIHGLCADGDNLWVGTYSSGLRLVDTRTQKVVKSYYADGKEGSLLDNNVFSIVRLRSGKMYFGTLSGVCTLVDDSFVYVENVPRTIVYDMCEDNKGNLWVGTYGSGVFMHSARTNKWTSFTAENKQIASNNVLSIFERKNGEVWITTENGGIYCYKNNKLNYEPIPADSPVRMAFKIVEDLSGKLWLTTNAGLIVYDTATKRSQVYTASNGLLNDGFNFKSAFCARNGRIYVGTLSGFATFTPENFQKNEQNLHIVATELLINNVVVDNFMEDSPLENSIVVTKRIVLNHRQNSIALKISSMLYSTDQEVPLEYKLEGYDKVWQTLSSENMIRYTNLPSGKYKLFVRLQAEGDSPTGQPYELQIVVKPPFYFAWWALLLYLVLAILLSYAAWRFFTQRSKMHRRLAMEKFEHEKEQELYQSKINFFTNVAHEIRTPLTLIKAPLENILKKDLKDNSAKEDLSIMDQNVDRLLYLTNQLLDFRKAERDGLKLNFERCNINSILQGVYVRFTTVMREKGVETSLVLPEEPLYAYVDKECLTKIFSNLINNAVKYCEKLINVQLKEDGENFVMILQNDGILIPKSQREEMFTPFVRGEQVASNVSGTGIGLPLAKTMAELHSGTLEILDDPQYNVFHLTLPKKQETAVDLAEEPVSEVLVEEAPQPKVVAEESAPIILIVEDNVQMLQYEKQNLQKYYDVLTAGNGEEALAILAKKDVDAIVSDAMMEPMDGFSLCRAIKENVNTSHIPFILLTALTLDSAKVEGMEAGADSYIEKPFSMDYLQSTLKNLLRARQNAKNAYAQSPFIPSDTVTISKVDEEFLKRLDKVMEENIGNSDFDITEMASQMFMSRTGLNRKIRGIFNLTPNNYIKIERLKKAAYLMKTKNYKVNEVCYLVGFTSPSYFTQCFYKQFGLLPKEFINAEIE